MLHSEHDKWAAPHGATGRDLSRDVLAELAREIEETQRRQGETLTSIVGRLRSIGAVLPGGSAPAQEPRSASEEPWDAASAEALMQSYENAGAASAEPEPPRGRFAPQQEWIGDRFHDVTKRIKVALSDLKPGSTVALLEARLDEFQRNLASALEDVVRRSDLDGLRLIEGHVSDLGQKLDLLEQHVARINGIEADVRSVMDQVSDERIAKLLDYDHRFAADLEAVAVRAAEEVHTRLGQQWEHGRDDDSRHNELRALIEASLLDRRTADAETASIVSGLSGRFTAQAHQYDDMRGLLERAIQEQRESEQTAFGMLDTLQQGLVSVLDRIDALEEQQAQAPAWAAALPPQMAAPAPEPDMLSEPVPSEPVPFGTRPHGTAEPVMPAFEGHYDPVAIADPMPVAMPAAYDAGASDAAADDRVDAGDSASDEGGSAVDRLRRDFIADARRAKMRAAANRAEQIAQEPEPQKRGAMASLEATRAALAQSMQKPSQGGSGRLFGASPKLLAVTLAAVVIINGGLLLLSRKADNPAVPQITIEEPSATDSPSAPHGDVQGTAPGAEPGSNLDDGTDVTALPPPADSQTLTLYGLIDDVLNPPAIDAGSAATPAVAPVGTTVARVDADLPDSVVADVYEQQVLANLSGKLGAVAAEHSPSDLLPDTNGRIDTAYTPTEIAPAVDEATAERFSALDLPPATVGPLSLRIAAANGDASAEFEVAARLAEGNGTSQNLQEAVRWYQRSASKGFAQSQYRLGTLYERGLGVTTDLSRARLWYGRAADQGNVKAMHNLAVLSAGSEAEPNYAAAMPWFQKAAEHGLADSQYNLAVLVENGFGGKPDRVTALKWYSLAAKAGDADAKARRDALKASLSKSELKSAEAMIAAFRPRPAIALINDARAAGEDWKKRARAGNNG